MRGTFVPDGFVPVASGRPGRRGFEFAATKRLLDLKKRYEHLRDDPGSPDALRNYSRGILREIRAELTRRNGPPAAEAA